MKYAFAGDRQISVEILKLLKSQGFKPSALFVSKGENESHAEELKQISNLPEKLIFEGNKFKHPEAIEVLKNLELDYIFGIHFPYIIPSKVLEIPKVGFLNLHPAYLPFNKGWHTPSWAIIDQTPYGATLHFMTEELDGGDIIHQKKLDIEPQETANSLYSKVLQLEVEVFKEAFTDLISLKPKRLKQEGKGTNKSKSDLAKIQEIDLNKCYKAEDLINKLRALTTNKIEEAAYFLENHKKVAIQVRMEIIEDNTN